MKHTTLASAMAVALTISSAAYAHQNDNILVNPSFEDQGLGWSYWFANIKDDHAYEGEFRGRVAQGVNHHISQIITVPETGYYDLSAHIMSPDNDAIYGFANLADEILLSENVKRNNQDKRYKKHKFKRVALEQGEQLKVWFSGSDQGGVSVDKVALVKTRSDHRHLKFNQIIQFTAEQQTGVTNLNKNNRTIEFHVPYGTDLSAITVDNIQISSTSTSTIANGDILDLTQPVTVIVFDEKGKEAQWTIKAIEKKKQVVVTSSNQKLQDSFAWAIDKTRRFVMTGQHDLVNRDENNNDGSGTADYIPSYWAGYFDRTAFYSRDFLHQASGAKIAGLDLENFSMFKTFARHSTESRKWYTIWAVNFDGTPHTIDYTDDSWFVREVPAQFEFVEKAWEQYQWTGDSRYIEDEDLWRFYTKVLTDYIELHDDQDPNGIAEGYGGIFEGSATYNERGEFPIEAGDGIGSHYQATVAYTGMLEARGEHGEAAIWREKAARLKAFFNEEWSIADPAQPLDNYVNIVQKDGLRLNDFGKENSWFMPMKLITEPGVRNDRYLDFIADNLGDGIGSTPEAPSNIEAYTYIPETYFPYNRNEEAWKWMQYIMDVKDEPHERPTQGTNGDYPEISFTFISNTIEGLMGIKPDAANHRVTTASHLTSDIDWLEVEQLFIGQQEVAIRHDGLTQSTLTNHSSLSIEWDAWFYGDYSALIVDGQRVTAKQKQVNGQSVSYVTVRVPAGQTSNVRR
ncbi:hypothetical protein J4N42_19255 [Vibrio sp. SCSIO 43135]|uniref:hypothetical protein n=1 Tax=Vibrio sp. SCSIO 43135 TaxID=2819096 RepID=UPI002075128B|nr:hypothetical protein [Vibrio sp. SCSIO 43135]USD42760.1 hypothetical protein J4N42_19255 [Vibrio sp. SCSIO 43135]